MARKSRTQPKQSMDTQKVLSKVYKTAVYVRLSAEKDETRDRKTLINQRNFIKNFVDQQMDMEIYDIYMDDEISGTTFDRPEFERMMSDMRAGRINCIVVKDLSRLGRDYVETGNLVERVFPMMGARFVAITDNYDSSKKDADLMVAVTNIANDLYAKDISKKACSSKQANMERGIPVGAVAYGYKVVHDGNKVRHMVIDDEPAKVVKRIFEEDGRNIPLSVIAKDLNNDGIPTPYQYRMRNRPEKLAKKPYLCWNVEIIKQLLKNEVYTGTQIMGKDRVCLYKNQKRYMADKKDWLVFENHHEAIITKAQFLYAQRNRSSVTVVKQRTKSLLRKKIVCGCCGSSMHIHPDRKERYFICTHRKSYGKSSCSCVPVKVETVYNAILSVIKEQTKLLLDEEAVLKEYQNSSKGLQKQTVYLDAVTKGTNELNHIADLKGGLYADYMEGLLDEKEYLQLNSEYSERIQKQKCLIEEYSRAANEYENATAKISDIKSKMSLFIRKRKLTQEIVDAFVSKVVIHENKNIEIILNFDDEIRKIMEMNNRRAEG